MQIASSARWTGRLWASASLDTTTDWIPSSRSARMTRTAISPRFAMRTLSKDRKRLPQRGLVGHIGDPRRREDPFREPGQDVARPELNEGGRALPCAARRGDPLYWRPDLLLQQFREIGRLLVCLRVDVRDDRTFQWMPRDRGERSREIGRDGAHRRRMERG